MKKRVDLIVDNINVKLSGFYSRGRLDAETSYFLPGYFHSKPYKRGYWDGKVHLLSGNKLPTGLLQTMTDLFDETETKYTIIDQRQPIIPKTKYKLSGIELRDYQAKAVDAMLAGMRGVVKIPTAGGKTFIAAAAAKALNKKAAYIVHTSALQSQTMDELSKFFKVSQVGGGERDFSGDIVVCMVQTLMRMVKAGDTKKFKSFKVLFIDECHHLASDGKKASWYIASQHFKNAYARFGLSATPILKKHGILIYAATGPLLYEVPTDELQEKGFIADSKITFYEFLEDQSLGIAPYAEAYRDGVVDNVLRNEFACQLALDHASDGRLVMLFVEHRRHGRNLTSIFADQTKNGGWIFLSGENPRKQVELYKKKAKKRDIKLLVVTRKLFGEGVDIPAVDVLVNLAGGKSAVAFTQMFGRGLRLDSEKSHLEYIDFLDGSSRYLKTHSRERIRHCKRLGQRVEIVKV